MTRKYLWQATYLDGTALREDVEGRGRGVPFEALAPEGLARFSLLEASSGREVAGFDLNTGAFRIRGHHVALRAGDAPVRPCARLGASALRQFKTAHADWRPGHSSGGTVVDAHHIGYAFEVAGARGEVLAAVRTADGAVRLDVRWAEARAPVELRLLVDGIPHEAASALRGRSG